MTQETVIGKQVDNIITKYQTSPIVYYPYESDTLDVYKQRTKSFGTGVIVVGRAILNPTKEKLSVIGNEETFDIAFLFSRLQLIAKFPTADEGEWLDVTGELTWFNRRYKIERVAPTGQVGTLFTLTVVLGTTILGARE